MRNLPRILCCSCRLLLIVVLPALCSESKAEGMAAVKTGAGVTILIHGWRENAGEPAWTAGLQSAIVDTYLGGEGHKGTISVSGTHGNLSASCGPWNFNLTASASCEIIVRIDWSAVANYEETQVTAQDIAAVIAPLLTTGQNSQPPLAQLPLHLIGHSRGAAVAYELARLLGLQGLEVDQVTSLDPHPLTAADFQNISAASLPSAIDTPVSVSENVLFTDNYWQQTTSPMGQSVSGAYNRFWASLPGGYHDSDDDTYRSMADHFNTHLMYQGTVDSATPLSDGEAVLTEAERGAWYTAAESRGAQSGFYYSRMSGLGDRTSMLEPAPGGNRIIDGFHSNMWLGGAGVREPLTWGDAVWPNIITVVVERGGAPLGRGSIFVTPGELLLLKYCYRVPGGGSTVNMYLDLDRNPYNGNNLATVASRNVAPTGSAIGRATLAWIMPALNTQGSYYLCSEIRDASARVRYLYAAPEFRVTAGASTTTSGSATSTTTPAATSTTTTSADVPATTTSTTPPNPGCVFVQALGGEQARELATFRSLRDRRLIWSASGFYCILQYYIHAPELCEIFNSRLDLLPRFKRLAHAIAPLAQGALDGGQGIKISRAHYRDILSLLDDVGSHATPVLRKTIAALHGKLGTGVLLAECGISVRED